MGHSLVNAALRAGHRVILMNRGHGYWGSPAGGSSCELLWHFLDWDDRSSIKSAARFIANGVTSCGFGSCRPCVTIVDFSCDTARQMELFLRSVNKAELRAGAESSAVGHYILISSDSVYRDEALLRVDEDRPTVAELATSAPRSTRRSYAFQKAFIEEALGNGAPKGCTVTIARLPDVIGPRDPTGRFWATMLWAATGRPLLFPAAAGGQVVSVVYSEDVSHWLLAIATRGDAWRGGTFNLACSETLTLAELTLLVARSGRSDAELVPVSDGSSEDTCDYYPSVVCGPLSIAKALASSPWRPTPLAECIFAAAAFFRSVDVRLCGREGSKVLRKLPAAVRLEALNLLSGQVKSNEQTLEEETT